MELLAGQLERYPARLFPLLRDDSGAPRTNIRSMGGEGPSSKLLSHIYRTIRVVVSTGRLRLVAADLTGRTRPTFGGNGNGQPSGDYTARGLGEDSVLQSVGTSTCLFW